SRLAVLPLAADSGALEEQRLALAVRGKAHTLGHSVLRHHEAGQLGRALEVVVRAGRRLPVDEPLGDAPAQEHRDPVLQLAPGHQEALLRRQLVGHPERGDPARDDRDLVDGIGVGDRGGDQRVAHLVMGDDITLLLGQYTALLLEPGDDTVDGLLEVGHLDRVLLLARRQQRRLVDNVCQVCARKDWRAAMTPRSTPGASTTARACNLRIASRPRRSGLSTTTWRSKRPGRRSAWSSTSGRFVAAMMMTPFEESKPSISARSWLRVCSRSSCPPMHPVPPA